MILMGSKSGTFYAINQNGQLIIEHSKHTNLSNFPNFIEARRYGGSVFSFFENVE